MDRGKNRKIRGVPTYPGGIPSPVIYETLGISQPQLTYWIQTNVVKPFIRLGRQGRLENGEPATALWGFQDFLELKTVVALRDHGLSLFRIRKVLRWLRVRGYSPIDVDYITDGHTFFIRNQLTEETIEVLGETGQYVLLEWSDVVKYCQHVWRQKSVPVK
jgi:hypothetical protein